MNNPRALADPLHQLTHAYKRRMGKAIGEAGIHLPITHIRALKRISALPGCTAQAISQRMRRDKAQITRVLNDLLADELIVKLDNPDDRRSQLLSLSPKGENVMRQVLALEAATVELMTQGLSPEEVQSFIRLAGLMASNLHNPLDHH